MTVELKRERAREHTQDRSCSVFYNLVSQVTCCYFYCILLVTKTNGSRLHKGMNTRIQGSLGDTWRMATRGEKSYDYLKRGQNKAKQKNPKTFWQYLIPIHKLGIKGNFLNLIKKVFSKDITSIHLTMNNNTFPLRSR